MRKILFRGKREDTGEWAEGYFMQPNPAVCRVYEIGKCAICYQYSFDAGLAILPVIPETVGQYTGLTDKNRNKIFEGDICRNTRTGEVVSVAWHGTMAGFVWSKREENSHLFDFGELFRAHDKYEVIGNIHDNPELLEGNV